jgi:ligand-binding SRPBCC domain-containing protein
MISSTQEEMWAFHSSVEALKVLTPPGQTVQIVGETVEVVDGAVHELKVKKFGLTLTWIADISDVEPPSKFVDTARKSPFQFWRHTHEFLQTDEGTLLRDTVDYQMPFGFLGRIVNSILIEADVRKMFKFRHEVTKKALEK